LKEIKYDESNLDNLKEIKWGLCEIDALLMIDHKNVVKMHEFYISGKGEKTYIIMERIVGPTLFDHINNLRNSK